MKLIYRLLRIRHFFLLHHCSFLYQNDVTALQRRIPLIILRKNYYMRTYISHSPFQSIPREVRSLRYIGDDLYMRKSMVAPSVKNLRGVAAIMSEIRAN